MRITRVLRLWLECGGCNVRVQVNAVPVTWTCTACGHWNTVSN